MSDDQLTLTRKELYELAWSKPMTELARDFGISDVALAKRCRNLRVPVPGRGYWARVAAGQTPDRPVLLEHKQSWRDGNALTVHAPPKETVNGVSANTNVAGTAADIHTRLEKLSIGISQDLRAATAAIKRTALEHRHPNRHQLSFARGEKNGAVLDLRVSAGTLDRALLFADSLMRAAESLGWNLVGPPPADDATADSAPRNRNPHRSSSKSCRGIGELLVEGERIAFRIEERMTDATRQPLSMRRVGERPLTGHSQGRETLRPTGALRLVRIDRDSWSERRKTWYDRRGRQLEEEIPAILQGFFRFALQLKERRIEADRRRREREEEQRQRRELEERRAATAKFVRALERQAGAWYRARFLRAYLRAACRAFPDGLSVEMLGKRVNFLQWAAEYINGLDPLHEQPRSEDMLPEQRSWGHSSELKDALSRLSGHEWADSWKKRPRNDTHEMAEDELD